jgi:outer membrane receptor for ferrienterochelin and colicins
MLRRKSAAAVTGRSTGNQQKIYGPLARLLVLACSASLAAPSFAREAGEDDEEEQIQEEIDLELELLSLDEQVVTVTKRKQSVAEAPAIVEVISREELLRRGYRDVAEALAGIPGVYVNYDYVFYDVGLRGISNELRGASRSIKVLINGQDVSFRAETTNFLGPELIPLEAIEQIEVIRGPASALYGANAFLGLVNIITRKGEPAAGSRVRLSGQLFHEAYGGANLEFAAGAGLGAADVFLALGQTYLERSGQKIRCTAAVAGEQPCQYATEITRRLLERPSFDDIARPASFFGRVDIDLGRLFSGDAGSLGRVNFQGSYQMLDYRGSFSDWGSLNYDLRLDDQGKVVGRLANSGNRVALDNASFRGQYEKSFLNDRLRLKLGSAYSWGGVLDSEHLKEVTGVVNRAPYGFTGYDTQAEVSWTVLERPASGFGRGPFFNELTFSAGVDYSRDAITYVPVGGAATMRFTTSALDNLGAWAQASATFWQERLGLVAGARHDHHWGAGLTHEALSRLNDEERKRLCGESVCYQALSWRAGATWQILKEAVSLGEDNYLFDRLYLKALYGTAFKAPSPLFLYQEDFLGERPLNPNPALLPQTVSSLELVVGSVHWKQRLELTFDVFYNHLENRAEFSRQGLAVVARNGVPVNTWGIEGELHFRWERLEFYGSLSWQRSRRDLGENLEHQIPDTFGYPDLMGRAGIAWRIPRVEVIADLFLDYLGRRVGHPFNRSDRLSERYTLAPYTLINFNLTTHRWKLWADKETRLQLGVRNLLDTRYDFPGFQPYYRYDVPGLPRTMTLTLAQDF